MTRRGWARLNRRLQIAWLLGVVPAVALTLLLPVSWRQLVACAAVPLFEGELSLLSRDQRRPSEQALPQWEPTSSPLATAQGLARSLTATISAEKAQLPTTSGAARTALNRKIASAQAVLNAVNRAITQLRAGRLSGAAASSLIASLQRQAAHAGPGTSASTASTPAPASAYPAARVALQLGGAASSSTSGTGTGGSGGGSGPDASGQTVRGSGRGGSSGGTGGQGNGSGSGASGAGGAASGGTGTASGQATTPVNGSPYNMGVRF